jgi:alkylation response protein AidB-like acyl-CoA dehydrogenase
MLKCWYATAFPRRRPRHVPSNALAKPRRAADTVRYMTEYPVARAFLDTRVQTIYGGTTEIMKEIIGRDIAR